ncbi:50S ribosomal protein L28 [Candidatus Peregrinibacteria bacterium CG_4_10_14_0_2_um_filter_43_11]|nr:MAG: 50S ribosomal protein L28 [Candidatus Peregrinibacteria bacterium CG_4_10_14_0_2_um_filter_43_11]
MAKVCEITGKKPSTGHNVSHSVRRTKRRFLPNLQKKKIWDPVTGTFKKMKVATSALRLLTKSKRVKTKKVKA